MTKIVTFADGFSSATAPTIESDPTKANVTLNNLSSTAVNADIIPADSSKKLGSSAIKWLEVFAEKITSTAALVLNGTYVDANNTEIKNVSSPTAGSSGANRTYVDNRVSDPANITQDSTHRFVTDAEKTAWNASAIFKDTYTNLVTWATTATDSALGFSTDTKILYYVVSGALQEIDVMRTISGTITSGQISVGTTRVKATVDGVTSPNANRKRLMITPITINGKIYLGGSNVTTANGKQIIGPDTLFLDWDASDYYLVSDNADGSNSIISIVEVV